MKSGDHRYAASPGVVSASIPPVTEGVPKMFRRKIEQLGTTTLWLSRGAELEQRVDSREAQAYRQEC